MRYHALDSIRGITLLSMMAYHAAWDLVYLFGMDWPWFRSDAAYVWQQSICWTFILLSGFCWPIGRHKFRRGLTVFTAGALLTAFTFVFMPAQRVVFGVLTLLGSCMLLMLPLERILMKVKPVNGFIAVLALFFLCRNINTGYLGFEGAKFVKLPDVLYRNYLTSFLGFPDSGFYSADYFSLLPWLLLFLTGYFGYRILKDRDWLKRLAKGKIAGIEWVGRNSLLIYLIHQPVIYLGLELIY